MPRTQGRPRRRTYLIPLGFVALAAVALPAAAFTETGIEHDVRKALGLETGQCEPSLNSASPWRPAAGLGYDLDEPRGTDLDGRVYLAGGITGLEPIGPDAALLEASDELTRFDPRGERYERLAPLPKPLNHIGVVAYRHRLYVLGGYGNRLNADTSDAFYRYDPDEDSWSRMPDMPVPRAAMAAGVIGHELIVAGGAFDNVAQSDAFAYDFRGGRWRRLPDMLSRREHVGATALGGRLYVFGGRMRHTLATDIAEEFDPARRRWRRLPPMPVPAGGLGVVGDDGEAIAVGGGDDGAQTVTDAVQAWDPRTERWSLLPAMRTPRHGQAVVSVGERIWTFGGSPCAYFNPTESAESLRLGRATG